MDGKTVRVLVPRGAEGAEAVLVRDVGTANTSRSTIPDFLALAELERIRGQGGGASEGASETPPARGLWSTLRRGVSARGFLRKASSL